MSLLVTGSIGIDSVETPGGSVEGVLGGSAIYFSLAASLFSEVRMVGVVGEDFDLRQLDPLRSKRIDLNGVEVRAGSRTFRWRGRYRETMNDRDTLDVQLNVLAERGPRIPQQFLNSRVVFLANSHPRLQMELLESLPNVELAFCDTMDLWIQNESAELRRLLSKVDGLVINESEARMLTGRHHIITAGLEILRMGPRFAIVKQGEYGSLLVSHDDRFIMPAYPTPDIIDPTGCGDAFAGGMMGYLASTGRQDARTVRAAMARGSVIASYVIESFSIDALAAVTPADVDKRMIELAQMSTFA